MTELYQFWFYNWANA